MRKRIHGKQSVPANILYSPERAMKFPTLVPIILRYTNLLNIPPGSRSRPSRGHQHKSRALTRFPRATHIREGTGYSRTLYTSKAMDQSNFII
jgi:hypothetical protein